MTAAGTDTPSLHGPYDDDTTSRQAQLAADTRDQLTDAGRQAEHLARALDHARQLTSTLHATPAGNRQ